jgi:hypothetical protein
VNPLESGAKECESHVTESRSNSFKGQQNLVNGSDPGTLIRTQTYKTERWRGAKGNRAEHKGELLERQAG